MVVVDHNHNHNYNHNNNHNSHKIKNVNTNWTVNGGVGTRGDKQQRQSKSTAYCAYLT